MNKEIFIPETVGEGLDLYDGMILNMYDGDISLGEYEDSTIAHLYPRVVHYADILKNGSERDSQRLAEKLGGMIDERWLRNLAVGCELYLQGQEQTQ